MADLKHADWLLLSTEKILSSIDPELSFTYVMKQNGGKNLVISNISESTMDKLAFLTNTDQNNNYLYLERFSIFSDNLPSINRFYEIEKTIINMWRNSDVNAFLKGDKLHSPFSVENLVNSSFKGNTFSEFVDEYTSLTPFILTTYMHKKIYEIEVNPDWNLLAGLNDLGNQIIDKESSL